MSLLKIHDKNDNNGCSHCFISSEVSSIKEIYFNRFGKMLIHQNYKKLYNWYKNKIANTC